MTTREPLPTTLDRYFSCERKKTAYFERDPAERAAYLLSRREGRLWTAYPCRHCDAWHLGHAPKGGAIVFGSVLGRPEGVR